MPAIDHSNPETPSSKQRLEQDLLEMEEKIKKLSDGPEKDHMLAGIANIKSRLAAPNDQ